MAGFAASMVKPPLLLLVNPPGVQAFSNGLLQATHAKSTRAPSRRGDHCRAACRTSCLVGGCHRW